jgi:hypothetical protein
MNFFFFSFSEREEKIHGTLQNRKADVGQVHVKNGVVYQT